MKRYTRFAALVAAFVLCTLPLCGCARTPSWNGPIAAGFAGGSGTQADPYLVRTAEELAYFAKAVNGGNTFAGQYIRLDADIALNNETFTFDADSGLVEVTDGTVTGYLGTGLKGEAGGKHITFDETATRPGVWYNNETGIEQGRYAGELRMWVPIGTDGNDFSGHFDGAGHTVSGLYISSHRIDQGLFGVVQGGTVKHVVIKNSYVNGAENIGAVVGFDNGTVTDCINEGIVNAGGAAGVRGMGAGGIVGSLYEGTVTGCTNRGTVLSATTVAGGIAGRVQSGTLSDCTNTGHVFAAAGMAGGVAGTATDSTFTACTAQGTVTGYTYVGALLGQASGETVSGCKYDPAAAASAFGHKADTDGVTKISAE